MCLLVCFVSLHLLLHNILKTVFLFQPWEESLEQGLPNGKVLLLQNFDPLATSADVRVSERNTV